jgi:hypothetical protein
MPTTSIGQPVSRRIRKALPRTPISSKRRVAFAEKMSRGFDFSGQDSRPQLLHPLIGNLACGFDIPSHPVLARAFLGKSCFVSQFKSRLGHRSRECLIPPFKGKLQTVIEDINLPNTVIRSHYGHGFIIQAPRGGCAGHWVERRRGLFSAAHRGAGLVERAFRRKPI